MNKLLMMTLGINSIKALEGSVRFELNGKDHIVELRDGKILKVVGPEGKKLKKVLEMAGIKATLKSKSDNVRIYEV